MKIAVMFPRLLHEKTFRRFWMGQTISLMGDQITSLALPLTAVLALHANARTMSLLTAAVWLPSVLFGIQSGAWVDRRKSRRKIMILSDVARALLLFSIPVAYFAGWLSTWFLLIVALLTGLFALLFNISSNTLFVSLLSEEQYVTASSLLNGSRAVSFLVGPGIAGWLVQIISAPCSYSGRVSCPN